MVKKSEQQFYIKEFLFGTIKLTKNDDPDKYGYSGYGIGFDARMLYSLPNSK